MRKNCLARGVVGNEDAKRGERDGEIARPDSAVQSGELRLELAALEQWRVKADEATCGSRVRGFVVGPELFGFLVAGAEVGELDSRDAARRKSAGHEACQVGDEVRLGKLRHEEGRCLRLTGSGEEEFDGFGDGEEIAASGGIGDGERKACGDLAGEEFCGASAGGENVAEAEDGAAVCEDNLFCDAFGSAHHGGGFDGLVGRDKDSAGMLSGGRCEERFGGEDVVSDGGQRLFFNERDVLVGGGVKYEARAVEREDLVEEGAIGDAAEVEDRVGGNAGKILLKIVEAVFGGFEEDDAGAGGGKAESECGADGTACTGDEDGLLNER